MAFTNLDVAPGDLPRLADATFHRLHPRHAPVTLGIVLLIEVPIVLAGFVMWLASPEFRSTPRRRTGCVGCNCRLRSPDLRAVVLVPVGRRHPLRDPRTRRRRALGGVLEKGNGSARDTYSTRRAGAGPIAKRFGLSTVKLFSAGTGHMSFAIPGLGAGMAAGIKAFILERHERETESEGRPVAAAGAVAEDAPGSATPDHG